MINNSLFISLIISLILTGIYYYFNKDSDYYDEDEYQDDSNGKYITLFIGTFIFGYLLLSSFYNGKKLFSGGSSETSNLDISGGNDYRPPF